MKPLILHLSDIHIHTYNRHDEYKKVFENHLYPTIKKIRNDNPNRQIIIVVTGDIIHLKLSVSNELYEMTFDFINNLIELSDFTIVTIGNHDYNEKNKDRVDILTNISNQILATENAKKYKFCKYSEVFELYGITFSHLSIYDGQSYWTLADDLSSKQRPYIGLFHGMINGVVNESNYTLKNDKVTPSKFEGFDYLLLGDIHKPNQIVNNNTNWRYPGSLIQQNMGESDYNNRGFLMWDIENNTVNFINIQQEFHYITLYLINGKCEIPSDICNNVKFRIFYDENSTYEERHNLETNLRQKYNVDGNVVFVPNFSNQSADGNNNDISMANLSNLDIHEQNQMILSLTDIEDDTKQKLVDVNKHINSKIENQNNTFGIWKPVTLKWNNLFTYGSGNEIDFSKVSGLAGIFANNSFGKSSIIEILLFAAFDKISKTNNNNDVLNASENEYDLSFVFETNGILYYIDKKGKRTKKTVKHIVDFYTYENGRKISLNGNNRIETYKKISTYLGTFDDFTITTLMTQFDNKGLINTKQTQRKTILRRFLGLEIFDKLYLAAKEEYDELKLALKQHDLDFIKNDIAQLNQNIVDFSDDIATNLDIVDIHKSKLDKLRKSLELKLAKQVTTVEDYKTDSEYISNIQFITNQITKFKDDITDTELQIKSIEDDLYSTTTELQDTNVKIDGVNAEIKNLEPKLTDLTDLHNRKNKGELIVADIIKYVKKIENLGTITSSNVIALQSIITSIINNSSLEYLHSYFNTLYLMCNQYMESVVKMNKYTDQLNHHRQNIDLLKGHEYDPNCEYCIKNDFVKNAKQSEIEYNILKSKYDDINDNINTVMNNINTTTNETLNRISETIQSLTERLTEVTNMYNEAYVIKQKYDDNLTTKSKLYNISVSISNKISKYNQLIYDNKNKISTLNNRIDDLNNRLGNIKSEYDRYKKYQSIISEQQDLSLVISKLRNSIKNTESEIETVRKEISRLERQKTVFEVGVEKNNELVQKITILEEKYSNYALYLDIVKNTLPNLLIQENLHILENEINSVISQLADFKLSFEYDKKDINIYTIKGNQKWSVQLNGGMETFISSIAIRVGLLNIKRGAKTNFILIDEGIGVLDKSKLEKLPHVFEYLESRYDFALFISHLDVVKDMANSIMTISKTNDKSLIVY